MAYFSVVVGTRRTRSCNLLENYQMTESLFEAATDQDDVGYDEIALKIRELLLFMGF